MSFSRAGEPVLSSADLTLSRRSNRRMDRDGRARLDNRHSQASIPASNSSRCRLMRAKLGLERTGKLLTKVAAVFYDLVSAHICSGVLANRCFADAEPAG